MENIGGTFLKKLHFLRKDMLKLTQSEAAERIGISLRYYQQLEKGDSWPSPEVVDSICKAFNVESWELFKIGSRNLDHQSEASTPTQSAMAQTIALMQQEIDSLTARLAALHPIAAAYEKAGPDIRAAVDSALSVSQEELEAIRDEALRTPLKPTLKKS